MNCLYVKPRMVLIFIFVAGFCNAQPYPFADEIAAYKKMDSLQLPPKGKIVFAGSSSFRLWSNVSAYFPESYIINRGFGGSGLPDLIRYTEDIILAYDPKQIVIYCGENDLVGSDKPSGEEIAARFRTLFGKIRQRLPRADLIFISIKPSPSRWMYRHEAITANERIHSFLSKQPKTRYIDVWNKMLGADGRPIPSLFLSDSLHMNSRGYEIWQKLLQPYLIKEKQVSKKFASIGEENVFNEVQRACFNYFWDGAEPNSGLARERFHADNKYPENDASTVTSGGAGFGVMAILAAIENHFISRQQGVERLEKIVSFLETADRFHGAWPHWWYGETGKVRPFSKKDNGGDLVETSYMLQGLLCARQYFQKGNEREINLAGRMDALWKAVEFDWFRNGKNVLYWHWSPNYNWEMNFPVKGYNECLIMYVLAASSPTHGIPAEVYHEGWADRGKIRQPANRFENIPLQLHHQGDSPNGGPLFWAHYSYLGLDPRGLKDNYADYWKENTNQSLINYRWCVVNPKNFKGYGPASWGLSSSYSIHGYSGHAPSAERDLGVIAPTAALSSFPYTPRQSMAAMMNWYRNKKETLWGPFGFYDAFSESDHWFPPHYLAIDQGPIVVMMENYKSGLLWNLFMSCPEVKQGLKKLGFRSPHFK